MLISSEYLELNRRLHSDPNYGTSGRKYAQRVLWLTESRDILDYGCGKRTLETWLGFEIKNYDPVTNPERPSPSEVVVCTDVLEHIEEGCLEAVLDDLRRVVSGFGYFTIATGPAKKVLPDGRNAH